MTTRRATLTLAALLLAACSKDEGGGQKPAPAQPAATVTTPAPGDAGVKAAAGDADVKPADAGAKPAGEGDLAALVPGPQATDLAAKQVKLPALWKGTGVLEKRADKPPRRAPAWAGIAAEVVEHDGQRFLVTTGRVSKIHDVQLARSTAENRARDEAKRWTRVDKQEGGAIREVWRDPRSGDTFAQVELPVPSDWTPGTPLGN